MRQKVDVQGQRTRMTWSCKFLYKDFQDFWVFVLLGFFVCLFVFCLLFQIADIALFILSLATIPLFALKYFQNSAAAAIALCHLILGVPLICTL